MLLKKASVLILDEATCVLNSESENPIKEAQKMLMKGRTCLMVAHRLSTINRADRIAVMSDVCGYAGGTPCVGWGKIPLI